jgi:hypothetical protein
MTIAKYSVYYVNKMGEEKQIDLDSIVGITVDGFMLEHPDCEFIISFVRNESLENENKKGGND